MSDYDSGYGTNMTDEEIAEADLRRHEIAVKLQAKRRLEMIKYEVNNEAKYKAKNRNYITPLDRRDITIEEYLKLKSYNS